MNTEKHLNAVYLVKCEIPKIKSILKMDPIYFLDEKKKLHLKQLSFSADII